MSTVPRWRNPKLRWEITQRVTSRKIWDQRSEPRLEANWITAGRQCKVGGLGHRMLETQLRIRIQARHLEIGTGHQQHKTSNVPSAFWNRSLFMFVRTLLMQASCFGSSLVGAPGWLRWLSVWFRLRSWPHVSSNPSSGSVRTAQSLEPAWILSLSLSLSTIKIKKTKKGNRQAYL